MTFLYIMFAVYIAAVNFYGFRYVKTLRDSEDAGERTEGDGKLVLTALLGGATTIYLCMFLMRYRLSSMILMIFLPLIAVLNFYCFYLGFRSIYLFL